jgi:hypothetical protein
MREHVSVLFGFGCVVSGEYGTGYRTAAEEALNPFDYCCCHCATSILIDVLIIDQSLPLPIAT